MKRKYKKYNLLCPQVFPQLVPLLLPLTQIALTGSLYTILAVAVERFLSITRFLLLPAPAASAP